MIIILPRVFKSSLTLPNSADYFLFASVAIVTELFREQFKSDDTLCDLRVCDFVSNHKCCMESMVKYD